jgi:hypothetical protein
LDDLKYIFAQPDYIEGVGYIYPIKLGNYEMFQEYSRILYVSKNHFLDDSLPLLAFIFINAKYLGYTEEKLKKTFEDLFSLVLRKDIKFCSDNKKFWFQTIQANKNNKEELVQLDIGFNNYDQIRSIIMKQNLMFEQKIYRNPKVQEWANKVIEARSKNSNITLTDIISTVSVYKGVSYEELKEYTLYQLYADFHRIRKMKNYEADVIFRSVSDKVTIEDFAEEINLFNNPYDNLFVNKSKLSNINKAIK